MRALNLFLALLILFAAPAVAQVPKTVLAENATTTLFGFASHADEGLDQMHSWFDPNEFLSIRYYSTEGELSTPETQNAIDYYGITGYPTVVFTGLEQNPEVGAAIRSGIPYREAYNRQIGPSPYYLLVRNFDVGAGSAECYLEAVSDPGDTSQMEVKLVLYEDNVLYNSVNQIRVTRDILPSVAVTASGIGMNQTIPISFTVDPGWSPFNLQMLALIQNNGTKEVLQAFSTMAKPQYSVTYYYTGEHSVVAPVNVLHAWDDIHMFNAGSGPDTFTIRIVGERSPAGWVAEVSDGTNNYTNEFSVFLNPDDSTTFHLEVTPTSIDYGIYRIEFYSVNDLANVKSIRFPVLTEGTSVLVVDDDGGLDYETYYAEALDNGGYAYGVWSVDGEDLTLAMAQNFEVLVWFFGEYLPNLEFADWLLLSTYLDGGGKLFITGQDLGWDMVENPDQLPQAAAFYQNYLHAQYVADNANATRVNGTPGDPIGDGLTLQITGGTGANNQLYPDAISPADASASTVFSYPFTGKGAIKADTGTNQVVYFGYGFEGISEEHLRATVMMRIMDWFGVQPALAQPMEITTLRMRKSGSDIELIWDPDPAAIAGFNLYTTDDEAIVESMRLMNGYTPIMTPPTPPTFFSNGINTGLTYYQILGWAGGMVESPN
ncbi:hypothetical protein ACFLU6_11705 [Acidobacteriota bacterium]